MASNTKDIVKFRSIDNSYLVILEKIVLLYKQVKQSDKYNKELDSIKSEFSVKKAFEVSQEILNALLNSQNIINLSEYEERTNKQQHEPEPSIPSIPKPATPKPSSPKPLPPNNQEQKYQFTKSFSTPIPVSQGISVTFIIQTSSYIISCCSNGHIYAMEINYNNKKATKSASVTKSAYNHAITSACAVQNNTFIVGYENGKIKQWEIKDTLITLGECKVIEPHSSAIIQLYYDGANCISCSKDLIKFTLLSDGSKKFSITNAKNSISSVLKLKKKNCIVISDTNAKCLNFADTSTKKLSTLNNIYTESLHGIVELSNNNIAVATSNEDTAIAIVDVEKRRIKHKVHSLIKGNPKVCLYFIDNITLCYWVDNYLYFISITTYTIIFKYETHTLNRYANMLFDKNNYIIIDGSNELSFFDLTKNKALMNINMNKTGKVTRQYSPNKREAPEEKQNKNNPKLYFRIDELQKVHSSSPLEDIPDTHIVNSVLVIVSQMLILIGTSKAMCVLYEMEQNAQTQEFEFRRLESHQLEKVNTHCNSINNIVQLDEERIIISTNLFYVYVWQLSDKTLNTRYLKFETGNYIYNTISLTTTSIASLHDQEITLIDVSTYNKRIVPIKINSTKTTAYACEAFIKVTNYIGDNDKYKVIVSIKYLNSERGELQMYDENFEHYKTISNQYYTFTSCIRGLYEIPDKPYIVTAYRKENEGNIVEQNLVLINLRTLQTETFDIKNFVNITNNCSFSYHNGTMFFVSENTIIQFKDRLNPRDVKVLGVPYKYNEQFCSFDLQGVCFNILSDNQHVISISHETNNQTKGHKYSLIVFKIKQT